MNSRKRTPTPRALGLAGLSPALVLLLGLGGRVMVQPQASRELAAPLATFPIDVAGLRLTRELDVPEPERQALQADDLLYREYEHASGRSVTLYVAYYGRQTGGRSIHSPTNCLPGSGWEPVEADRVTTMTAYGPVEINRYLIEHGTGSRALVYYWYQGRGRIAANEYRVKKDLLWDAVVDRRTDEALVRLVVPLSDPNDDLASADALAAGTVPLVADALAPYLPG